jgi:hypothetical protein
MLSCLLPMKSYYFQQIKRNSFIQIEQNIFYKTGQFELISVFVYDSGQYIFKNTY